MPHLLKYAKNSARKFAGLAEGYLRIHEWFDGSKAVMADFLHRALRHHAEAIFLGERIFRRLVTARAASAKARNAVMARRYSFCLRVVAVVVCAPVVTTVFSQSQGPIQPPKQLDSPQMKPGEGIKVDVSLALVNVSVTDPLNRLVTGLDKDNFLVEADQEKVIKRIRRPHELDGGFAWRPMVSFPYQKRSQHSKGEGPGGIRAFWGGIRGVGVGRRFYLRVGRCRSLFLPA